MSQLYTWKKLSAAKWEDVWPERLAEFADRLAITTLAGHKTIRLEVFALSEKESRRLVDQFGGSVVVQRKDWLSAPARPRKPLNIRGRLAVVSVPEAAPAGKPTLLIPAGLAFGTGEHATTLNCLRFLADFAAAQSERWEMLDLGCGTGILGLAGRMLGAHRVLAGDFDPDCVQAARRNVRTNQLTGVTVRKLDVFQWEPDRQWPVVAANLYSTILIAIAPKLARCLAPGGTLIFSGVLREQEPEVSRAFARAGLKVSALKHQGKWVAGTASPKPSPRR